MKIIYVTGAGIEEDNYVIGTIETGGSHFKTKGFQL